MRTSLLALVLSAVLGACVSHSTVTDFHGVNGMRGVPVEYQTTSSWALHGLFIFPLWGNATKKATIEAFTEEAASRGGSRTRITQTGGLTYWFIFPPISFFIHPVNTTVEGDVEPDPVPR